MTSRHHRVPLAAANDTSDEIERTVVMLTRVEIVADGKPWIDPRRATCDPWCGNGGRQQLAERLTSTARRALGRLATLKANVRAWFVRALWRRSDTNRGPNPTLARREHTGGLEGRIDLRNPPCESRRRRHGRFSQRTLMMTQRPFHLAMCM